MSDFLCFLDKVLGAEAFRHLYSNVDNILLATSGVYLEECLKVKLEEEFEREKGRFFQEGEPGHLKVEWTEKSQDWKFISGMPQNYSLMSATASRHKNSALNHISSQQSYDASCAILEKKFISFEQQRRTNKLANLETCIKTFMFNKSK
jgi:hypothetical protein